MKLNSYVDLFKAIVLICAFALMLGGCATTGTPTPVQIHHPARQTGRVLEQWGVDILSLRITAAGLFLDLRYRVLDADKAQSLADAKKSAYVLDPLTQVKHNVAETPTAGQLRERGRKLIADRVYSIVFANPGKRIKPGMKVTLVVGDLRLDNVEVQ